MHKCAFSGGTQKGCNGLQNCTLHYAGKACSGQFCLSCASSARPLDPDSACVCLSLLGVHVFHRGTAERGPSSQSHLCFTLKPPNKPKPPLVPSTRAREPAELLSTAARLVQPQPDGQNTDPMPADLPLNTYIYLCVFACTYVHTHLMLVYRNIHTHASKDGKQTH